MDFGGGFATGIGAGMGSGIAVGVSSGRKQAINQIRDHVEQNGFTIHDRFGAPVKVDEFLEGACSSRQCCSGSKPIWIAMALALALAVAAAIYILIQH